MAQNGCKSDNLSPPRGGGGEERHGDMERHGTPHLRLDAATMVQKVGMSERELEAIASKRGTIRIELKSHHIADFHN